MTYIETLLQGQPVVWKTLGEVSEIVTAQHKLKSNEYEVSGKIPIIDQGAEYIAGYTNKEINTLPKYEYIIFGDHSEHIKYVDFEFAQGADGLKIIKTKAGISKYFYYAFIQFYTKELSYKRHWTKAKNTSIPIPPLRVQEEIVGVLDRFDALVHSLEEGLPRAIELCVQQYAYYREQLLCFPLAALVN